MCNYNNLEGTALTINYHFYCFYVKIVVCIIALLLFFTFFFALVCCT